MQKENAIFVNYNHHFSSDLLHTSCDFSLQFVSQPGGNTNR
jgi:hypothetical protein